MEGRVVRDYLRVKGAEGIFLAKSDPAKIAEPAFPLVQTAGNRTKMSGEKGLAMGVVNLFAVHVDLEEMGRRIDKARIDAGMSVFELAVATVIGESLLRRYLKGETEPGARRLARIAEVLDVSADWLIQNSENPRRDNWDGKTERRASPPASGGAPADNLPVPKRPRRRRSA